MNTITTKTENDIMNKLLHQLATTLPHTAVGCANPSITCHVPRRYNGSISTAEISSTETAYRQCAHSVNEADTMFEASVAIVDSANGVNVSLVLGMRQQ